ncbi:MAG: M3 family metallopeptidase [Planctomycetaceae bacterium]|nr:M3 family metallopeptidase [Planctomycetaceae bacterium]
MLMSATDSENPLLIAKGLPAYDRIRAEHIQPAVDVMLNRCRQILQTIEASSDCSWQSLMEPMEEIDLMFEYGWSPIGHLLSVANADDLRDAHEAAMPSIVEFSLEVRQSEAIYGRLRQLKDSDKWQLLDHAQQRIIEKSIQSAELSGIALQGQQRERFNEIEQELSQLGTDFSNHVLDATKAFHLDLTEPSDVVGLPSSLRRSTAAAWSRAEMNRDKPAATPEGGPWRVTLDFPCFGPFMEHCQNRDLREKVFRAYISRASTGETDNCPLIVRILALRKEQAALLGFASYADLSLSRKMAASVDAVQQMFDQLYDASYEAAKEELAELNQFAAASGAVTPLAHWDIAYWAERLREERFSFTDEQLRPYFSLERVLDGLFGLCHRLFGITVRQADGKAPVWNSDVRYFEVCDDSGSQIAGFYLDPYSRPENKRGGAWMSDCVARSMYQGKLRLPVAHLVCNGTPPVDDVPSLMTFREVETLFHEFGHGLQHMLTTVDYRDAAGISGVEWDAVELPSQFMENWCYHRPTLMGMAVHYETAETLPEDLFQKICSAKNYRAASMMLRQLSLGMTDMELHAAYKPDGEESPFDIERRIAERTSLLPPLPENRFLCSFQHIFAGGYSAGYYSYKWAEVLSADAFAAFEEAGLDNETAVSETGHRFRDTVLAQGGSRHPMDIFRDFRGREPNAAALLRHCGLLNE